MYTKWQHHTEHLLNPPQNKELELMLAGKKPLTMLFGDEDDKDVSSLGEFNNTWRRAIVEQGWAFTQTVSYYYDWRVKETYVALPDQAWRLQHIERARRGKLSRRDHVRIGFLLGYSKAQIKHFLGNWKHND